MQGLRVYRSSLLLLPLLAGLVLPADAWGKDLRGRLGVGVELPHGTSVLSVPLPPLLSLKYTLPSAQKSVNSGIQLLLGGGMGPDADQNTRMAFQAQARFLWTFVAEDNCNVFAGGGAGAGLWNTFTPQVDDTSGVVTQVESWTPDPFGELVIGIEAFPFGLENFGVTAQGSIRAGLVYRGTGGSLGFHYHF